MKILIVLGIFLIAAIQNANIVQAEDPKPAPGIKLRWVSFLKTKFHHFNGKDSDIDDQQIEIKCNNNGGPSAYNTIRQGMERFRISIDSIINSINTTVDGQTEKDFAEVCRSMQSVNDLLNSTANTIKPCLNLMERRDLDLNVNVSFSTVDYVCQNNGSSLFEFYATNAVECLNEKLNDLHDDCTANNSVFNHFTTHIDNTNIPLVFSPPTATIQAILCTDIDRAQNCSVRRLNECKQKRASKFVNTFWNIYKKGLGCETILKGIAANTTANSP
ncbi:27 kDa glycoprotein-like [Neodiprion fabricii]|uniref:27 kDa glycoprotein-like n=1 Tax=Neodiprion fabricii TaxID=2872261 RepID=UPI001ED92181|nr:27 kDa glycoprotein-like [Neodiprion fabricii]